MHRRIDMRKAAVSAIVANALQIVAVALLAVMLYHNPAELDMHELRLVILVCAVTVCWGAFMDIGAALTSLRIRRHEDELRETCGRMEELNRTLRAQRHDFKNHMQVVYGLIGMGEYKEAQAYIERVYGDIQLVSSALKTASPAVNALLAAKAADCGERGIRMETRIRSAWQDLSLPGWEMCRVLGNLIDNAIDAMADPALPRRELLVEIGEDIHAFTFRVFNTGSRIPPERLNDIFERGYTTKSAGRGMGLSIVLEIMEENGGEIRASSDETGTAFCGRLPKTPPENA